MDEMQQHSTNKKPRYQSWVSRTVPSLWSKRPYKGLLSRGMVFGLERAQRSKQAAQVFRVSVPGNPESLTPQKNTWRFTRFSSSPQASQKTTDGVPPPPPPKKKKNGRGGRGGPPKKKTGGEGGEGGEGGGERALVNLAGQAARELPHRGAIQRTGDGEGIPIGEAWIRPLR